MSRRDDVFDVVGPVQAEVFVVYVDGGQIHLTGPCGADPWLIEVHEDEDPLDVVARMARSNVGEPIVAHSTSWRRERSAVVLSFVVVIPPELAAPFASVPIERSELARNTATTAPAEIAWGQVVEHGLRHLAWLASEDPVVRAELPPAWHDVLARYVPEPFRHLSS